MFVASCIAPSSSDAQTVPIFNGKDLEGWVWYQRPPKEGQPAAVGIDQVWSVRDGVLHTKGKPTGYIRTEREFDNYVLTVEQRHVSAGNGGILFAMTGPDKVWPRCLEAQGANGEEGDIRNVGGWKLALDPARAEPKRLKRIGPSSEKPPGEWETIQVVVDHGRITVSVNGVLQNVTTSAESLAGRIGLQSEGGEMEFRRVEIAPIERREPIATTTTKPTTMTVLTAPSEGPPTVPLPPGVTPIFDGQTLDGWVVEPPNAINISRGEIVDLPSLAKKLTDKSDPVSAFVAQGLNDLPSMENTKELGSAVAKHLSSVVVGPSVYDEARFAQIKLRHETDALLKANPQGRELARLNRMLLEDAYPTELWQSPAVAWRARDGIFESLGAGRGVIHTTKSFDRYRVIFDVRHRGALQGQDHRAGVLVFCNPYEPGEKPINDALGGIQFQLPNGGSWDYRIGKNNSGKGLFDRVLNPKFDEHEWSRVEILVDPPTGTARMAVAQPVGSKAVEVLRFRDETAGTKGPFALQMHNRGLFDEFANIAIEENPTTDELITTK